MKTDVAPFKHGQLYVGEKPNYDNMDPVTYHQRSEIKSDSAIGIVICDFLYADITFQISKMHGQEVITDCVVLTRQYITDLVTLPSRSLKIDAT